MLSEMMDAMRLKPKEFVQGKMHLPMYRTLYLDKMLEENEEVYSRRDSHFREVVKGFKTVKDADFEEPESLSKIMRNYQKNGYKWLRTWRPGALAASWRMIWGWGRPCRPSLCCWRQRRKGRKAPPWWCPRRPSSLTGGGAEPVRAKASRKPDRWKPGGAQAEACVLAGG